MAAAAAAPFVGPAAANAAVAGANPATTTVRPDLRSATVTNVDATNVVTTVQYCFDKGVSSLPQAPLFSISTYDRIPAAANDAVRAANTSCVDARFNATDVDAPQDTIASAFGLGNTVAPNDSAVSNPNQTNSGNFFDSTSLSGSVSTAGTAGHTTAPDLTGITINNGTSTVTFQYDQPVKLSNTQAQTPSNFQIIGPNGDSAVSDASAASPATVANANNVGAVQVKFTTAALLPANGGVPATGTTNAVRGLTAAGAVTALGPQNQTSGVPQVAVRPGSSGFTNRPDLTGTTVNSNGSVDFTFDETVTNTAANNLQVVLSNGTVLTGDTAGSSVVNGNTIRVTTFGGSNIQDRNENVVLGSAQPGAVTGVVAPAGRTNVTDSSPAGGNVGAKAVGYTDGPDALRVTFDNSTGVANVFLDARFSTANVGNFGLLDDAGSQIATAAISATGSGGGPGTSLLKASFTQAQLAGARTLILAPGAATSANGATNVPQQISPTGTAANLKFR